MAKFIYFASRNPDMTPEMFRARWRRHGAMATKRASWRNMLFYIQADTLLPPPIDGLSVRFDGFSMGHPAEDFQIGPEEHPALDALARDELEIFSSAIAPRIILAEPEILLDCGEGATACLAFNDAIEAQKAAGHYANGSGLLRVVINHVTGGSRDPIDCQAIVELCAMDAESLAMALGSQPDAPWRAANFAIVAQEHLLWDRRGSAPEMH